MDVDVKDNILDEKSEPTEKGVRSIAAKFYICALASLLVHGTSHGMTTVQSSINTKENVGTKALGIGKIVSACFTLFCTPLLLRKCGGKWTVVAGETTYLLFIAANFYPGSNFVIAGGILKGFGNAMVWATLPIYNIVFGKLHSYYGSKEADDYARKYTGIFFAIHRTGQILANMASFIILQVGREMEAETGNFSIKLYKNLSFGKFHENCGANDCLDSDNSVDSIGGYVASESKAFYVLLGVFCTACCCGIALHSCFLVKLKTKEEACEEKTSTMASTVKETVMHLVCVKQILLFPQLFYIGLISAFVIAEMNRAYTSCVLGVEKVGLILLAFDLANVIASISTRRAIGKFGRNAVMCLALFLDSFNFVFCLFWRPSYETRYIIAVSFAAFGATDALWRNCSIAVYVDYFPKKHDVAFSIRNLGVIAGLSLGFLWSPLLCVRTKIYAQIGLLLAATMAYAMAEITWRRTTGKPSKTSAYGGDTAEDSSAASTV